MKVGYVVLLCFIISVLCMSCGKQSAEGEINSLMDRRENAFNSKELQSYLTVFSGKYKDNKGGIDALRKRVKKNFETIKTIRFVHVNRDIFVEEENAKIVQSFTLTCTMDINGKEEEYSIKGKEKFELKKIDSNWLIVAGE